MILRIDPNKILHPIKQSDIYSGEVPIDSIQILVHPSLLQNEITNYKYILYFKSNAISEKSTELFLSSEQQNGFYILETTFDEIMINTSGFLEVWIEIKDSNSNQILKSSVAKIHIKPSQGQKTKSIEISDEYKTKLSTIESKISGLDGDFKRLKNERTQPDFDNILKLLKDDILSDVKSLIAAEVGKIQLNPTLLSTLHKISETGSYKDLSDTPDIQSIIKEQVFKIIDKKYKLSDIESNIQVDTIGLSDLEIKLNEINDSFELINRKHIDDHNSSCEAHKDIRELIENIKNEIVKNNQFSHSQLLANMDYLTIFLGINSISTENMRANYDSCFWDAGSIRSLVEKSIIDETQFKEITGKNYYEGYSSRRRRRQEYSE